jgi:hypothetical protein
MANNEQIPPLLASLNSVLASSPTPHACSTDANTGALFIRQLKAPQSAFAVIGLKTSIGSNTQTYLSGTDYTALREEREPLSSRDTSSCGPLVPIRNDPEMVVNLGLHVGEAGLRRLGVTV